MLLRWFHEGLEAFEYTCPTGRTIYDRYYDRLINLMANPADLSGFDEFIAECRKTHDVLKQQLEQGRDRLLEMHSNGGEAGNELAAEIADQDEDTELVTFALNLFDIVGINQDDRSDNMIALTPSDHMLVPDFRVCRKTAAPSPLNVSRRCPARIHSLSAGNTRLSATVWIWYCPVIPAAVRSPC